MRFRFLLPPDAEITQSGLASKVEIPVGDGQSLKTCSFYQIPPKNLEHSASLQGKQNRFPKHTICNLVTLDMGLMSPAVSAF